MLREYLEDRMRRYERGEITKAPSSREGAEAESIWNDLRGMFIAEQNLNMYGNITIKLVFALSGNVYCSKSGPYYERIRKNLYRPETVVRIIFKLATDDGIAVTRKDDQTICFVESDGHIAIIDDRVVYEFAYAPTLLSN